MKTCKTCKETKNDEDFYRCSGSGNRSQSWCKKCTLKSAYKARIKARNDCLVAYGNKCFCCGEIKSEFLGIDHINGGGREHRKVVGARIYFVVRKEGYPKDKYRLLCHNCNLSLGFYGYCPHSELLTKPKRQ